MLHDLRRATLPPIAIEKDVVNTHGETLLMKGESQAVSALAIGAGQLARQHAMRIGNRGVVEVATENHRLWQPRRYEAVEIVCLRHSQGHRL